MVTSHPMPPVSLFVMGADWLWNPMKLEALETLSSGLGRQDI